MWKAIVKWLRKLMPWIDEMGEESDNKQKQSDDKPNQEPDEFTTAQLHTCPKWVASWPIVSTLTAKISGSRLYFEVDNNDLWKPVEGDIVAEMHTLLNRDGAWHCGPADGVHKLPSFKGKDGACVPDGDSRTYVPKPGEKVGLVLTGCCRNGRHMRPQQRTSIAWMVWS